MTSQTDTKTRLPEDDEYTSSESLLHADIDENLMREVMNDSEHALRMLIEKWKNPLVNFIYSSTRDFQLSEDIAITAFQKLYAARKSYQSTAKFSTYLFKIARNLLISQYRKNQVRPTTDADISELSIATEGSSEKNKEVREAFENAITTLPVKQREAISLLVQEDLSYAEIAEIMNESVPSVKTLINRARTFLREAMKEFATT